MRTAWAATIVLTVPLLASAQDPLSKAPPPRYGIAVNIRTYPQASPKESLESAIKAIEANRYDVLMAHLIEAKVTEARAVENGRLLENDVEKDLQKLREQQRAKPLSVAAEEKLPFEPVAFSQFVKAEAKVRGFKATIEEVRRKFAADTSIVPELKRYARDGTFAVTGDTAKATLKTAKGKGVFFTKANDRWFLEDRKEEAAK